MIASDPTIDYSKVGMNNRLQSEDSLANIRRRFVTAEEFSSLYTLPTGAINYTNLTSTARQYTAIVSLSGEAGTFKDIQLAINYVNGLGGGKILIKNGTYTLSVDITLYSNIWFEGESMDGVIIDFNNASFQMLIEGTGNASPSGTISVSHDDTTVTGSGTAFISEVSIGEYLLIDDTWYEVESITDDTHVELVMVYRGKTQTGLTYYQMDPKTNIWCKRFTIQQSADSVSLLAKNLKDCFFENIRTENNTSIGISFEWVANSAVRDVYSHGNGNIGIEIENTQSTYFLGLSAHSNNSAGVYLKGSAIIGNTIENSNSSHNDLAGFFTYQGKRNVFLSCEAYNNNGDGFSLNQNGEHFKIIVCASNYNGSEGIDIDSSTHYNKIVASEFNSNSGTGINITTGATKNIILGNEALNNTVAQLTDNGTSTELGHNIIT